MSKNYTVYHLHSMLSNGVTNIDSVTKYEEYVDYASSLDMKALAFSEHGSIFQWVKKKNYIESKGMKYIHAEEFYVAKSLEEKVRDNYHCILIARNYDGVKELNRLSSMSFNRSNVKCVNDGKDRFYYTPRITFDELINTTDNIIITSACFLKGTKVQTKVGIKNIEDISRNDYVINMYGEWEKVNYPTQIKYNDYGYKFYLHNDDVIKCTKDHKFLVASCNNKIPRWISAENIAKKKCGSSKEYFLYPIKTQYSNQKVLKKELWENSFIIPKRNLKTKLNDITITPEFMRMIGIFIGDGCISLKKNPRISFTLNYNEYYNHYQYLFEKIENQLGLKFSKTERKYECRVDVTSSSVDLINLFYWLFGDTKANTKHIPNVLKHISKGLDMELFYGYLLSDGYVGKTTKDGYDSGRYTSATISKQLNEDLKDLLDSLNISYSTYSHKEFIDKNKTHHNKSYYIESNSKEYLKINKNNNVNHNDIIILISNIINHHKKYFVDYNSYIYKKRYIKNVTKIHINETVYCLNNNTHSFVCENVIAHNCLGGILNSKDNDIKTRFLKFMIKNKHRCFLEIQHHKVDEQIKYNKILYTISQKYDLKLVAGTDTHSLNDKHVKGRSILQKSKNVFFDNEDGWDLTFKSYEELCNAYKEQNALPEEIYLAAIENTNLIADMVEPFELDYSYKYPHLWEEPEKLFKQKIKEGIVRRGVNNFPNKQEYFDRIKYEMKAYKHNKAIDFMLLMEDICSWCSDNDIQIGYGRGSCNGSIIAWLLGITEMDSIKYGLNFDRFMNIERVSLSDIDTDFPPSRRDDVKNYIFNKVGLHCCDIITFNTIALKGSIRDVARALNIPLDIVGNICDNVEDNEEKYREEYPELFELVDIVNGTVVSVGSHPCGSVTCEFSLDDTMGLFTTSTSEYPISQINMKEIDSLNYVKLDLLALDTIELINETCKLAGIERLTPDNVDINDDKVWNSIRDDTTQIFQWEGTGESYIKDLLSDNTINKFKEVNENVDKMTLLSIGNSAIRPAGASYREDLKNGVVRKTGSKAIDDFLSNTFGYLVFQCQIIEFLHKYCGFTMGEADIVRRGFAKKTGTEQYIPIIKNGGYLNENKKHYINGFIQTMKDEYNIDKDKSEKDIVNFIQVIEDASSYLFSLNHSQPYSFEGYVSGYLRYYYPLEFLTSAFKINKDRQDKIAKLTEYAKKVGITINPIKFGKSSADYTMDKKNNAIYKGVSSIKFCNEQIAEELLELSKNKYNSFVDLLKDINEKTSVNSRQLNILTILNFFSDYGKNGYLLKIIELYNGNKQKKYPALGTCKSIKKDMLDKYSEIGLSEFLLTKYSNKITPKMFSEIDNIGLLNEMCSKLKNESISLIDQVKYEIEYLGYTQYNNDNISDFYYIVTEFKTYKDATKPSIMLHNIKTGKETKARIKKSSIYKANPFGQYSILRIDNFKYDLKKRKNEDGEWVETDEYECVLEEYQNMKEL